MVKCSVFFAVQTELLNIIGEMIFGFKGLMSHYKTAGQNHYIKAANKSLKNEAKFKYLRTLVTNQNCIHKQRESKVNFREYLLPCSSESSVFLPAIPKHKD
jgi:hypothetical protein